MTSEEVRKTVIDALTRIAPEIDPASIDAGASFRDQLDLDSMDFLNFVLAVHDRLGIEIPEADYPRLATLEGAVAYLAARLGAADGAARGKPAPDVGDSANLRAGSGRLR